MGRWAAPDDNSRKRLLVEAVHIQPRSGRQHLLDYQHGGLVAADRLPTELVGRMRDALVASLTKQRTTPEGGVEELLRRHPEARAEEAREGWRLVEPLVFTGEAPGSMDDQGWRRTLDVLCAARGLDVPSPPSVYRPEFATGALTRATRSGTG